MVVAQLVELVRGSNPVISKFYIEHLLTVNCIEKTKIKKKVAGNGPSLKTMNRVEKSFGIGKCFSNMPKVISSPLVCFGSIDSTHLYSIA